MSITEKDLEIMRKLLDEGLDAVLEEATPSIIGDNEYFVFPIGIYLGCSKSMALQIYKTCKPRQVLFQENNKFWLLDHKGELTLIK